MRADSQTLHRETRDVLKRAMLAYEGDPVHVTIYALDRALDWNDVQAGLARTDHPSDAERIRSICDAVDDHLDAALRDYLDIR